MPDMTKSRSIPPLSLALAACCVFYAVVASGQQQAVPNSAVLETEAKEVRRYSVEMIIFQYVGTAAGTTENFQPDQPEEPFAGGEFIDDVSGEMLEVEQAPEADLPMVIDVPAEEEPELPMPIDPNAKLEEIFTYERAGLVLLDPEDYVLGNVYDKLVKLDAYEPLMHTAWIQPTVEKEDTIVLPLRRLGNPPLRLNGTVSLYLSRFLHLVVDLALEQKAPQRMTATEERVRYYGDNQSRAAFSFDPEFVTPSTFYRIQEDRIVRNGELRYYDHPKFGVIAKITRVEEEGPEEDLDMTEDLLPGIN
jgi:hypothetical protein